MKPKTISDLMQYKRWLDRHGIVSEFLHEQEINEDDSEIESIDGSDESEEANQELIEWLRDWEEARTLNERVNTNGGRPFHLTQSPDGYKYHLKLQ